MTSLYDQVRNSIWHAFKSLGNSRTDETVPKSRLKVLTASLGTLLGCLDTEKGLHDHRSTPYLNFHDFMFYLQKELFALRPQLSIKDFQKYKYEIEDVCWTICKSELVLSDAFPYDYYFKLFRMFCTMGEFIQISQHYEVVMSLEEVHVVAECYDKAFGKGNEHQQYSSMNLSAESSSHCSFEEFLEFLKNRYAQLFEKEAIIEATNYVYEILVENVIKKGHLKKMVSPVGLWWEMWFVLKQYTLSWCNKKLKSNQFEEIEFYNTKAEVANEKGCQFVLNIGSKIMTLCAEDYSTKLQWIAAFNTAFKHCQTVEPYQQYCASKRNQMRNISQAKQEEERFLFEQQKEARAQLEQKLFEENKRRKELEEKEMLLLKQLNEERQAKRDEEIVRNLQSRMLAEEWERREVLEKTKAQKEEELEEERRKREELEKWKEDRQTEIEQLTDAVSSLQKEKEELSGTLKKTKMVLASTSSKISNKVDHHLKRAVSADFSRQLKSGHWVLPPPDPNVSSGDSKQ